MKHTDQGEVGPHAFTPRATRPTYSIVICGDDDRFTGRSRVQDIFINGSARDKSVQQTTKRTLSVNGRAIDVELTNASASWAANAAMVEYHAKYAHGFLFVFNAASRATLQTALRLRELVAGTAHAMGPLAANRGAEHAFLVANLDSTLSAPEFEAGRSVDESNLNVSRAEAMAAAEAWDAPGLYCEINTCAAATAAVTTVSRQGRSAGTDSGSGSGVDEVLAAMIQTLEEESWLLRGPARAAAGFAPKPPRRLLLRRTLDHLDPRNLFRAGR